MKTKITSSEAANILQSSGDYVLSLINSGELICHSTGCLFKEDVERFKEQIDNERRKVLDELVALSQELDMGYE